MSLGTQTGKLRALINWWVRKGKAASKKGSKLYDKIVAKEHTPRDFDEMKRVSLEKKTCW
ncbi:unnamed protein product, partial [Amoebophrya sp. A25]|eukprot:GSA25T00005166001.1